VEGSVRRVLIVLVGLGALMALAMPAAAEQLYAGESLRVGGHAARGRLVVKLVSLSDLEQRYLCRLDTSDGLTRFLIRGRLNPHEIDRAHLPPASGDVRDLRVRCHAHVFDDVRMLWSDGRIEVLAKAAPRGRTGTDLSVYNVTSSPVRFRCAWRAGNPPSRHTLHGDLGRYLGRRYRLSEQHLRTFERVRCRARFRD
jgi:hypothetical protein